MNSTIMSHESTPVPIILPGTPFNLNIASSISAAYSHDDHGYHIYVDGAHKRSDYEG